MIGATVPLVAKASEVWFVWVGSRAQGTCSVWIGGGRGC